MYDRDGIQHIAGDVFDGVLFCAPLFFHEMSWVRSGTELNQFLSTYSSICSNVRTCIELMSGLLQEQQRCAVMFGSRRLCQ